MRAEDEKGFIPFEIEALTPIHIGSGEDLSPLDYTLRQTGEASYEIWLLDTAHWLSDCASEPGIARALELGNMAALRNLLNASARAEAFILARIPVHSARLGKELLLKRNAIENRAEIMPFVRNPFTHTPYLPASSLKGAISTAITDYLNEKRRQGKPMLRDVPPPEARRILEEMYGKINTHAMKALKIADIALPQNLTCIRAAIGYDLAPGKALPKTPCETLDTQAVNSFGIAGSLRLCSARGEAALRLQNGERLTVEDIGVICNQFYRSRLKAEFNKFYTRPHFEAARENMKAVIGRIENLDAKNEILLRVGRYSHIECVTISGNPPPMPKGYGTSRTLADGQMPFGWLLLKRCSMEKYTGLQNKTSAYAKNMIAELKNQNEILRRKQQENEARAQAEAEAIHKQEEMLALMSEEERAIWELEQENANENQASALYSKLGEMGDFQEKAALALMHFWQRIGKWEGKQLTRKQKEKVNTVRAILEKMRG